MSDDDSANLPKQPQQPNQAPSESKDAQNTQNGLTQSQQLQSQFQQQQQQFLAKPGDSKSERDEAGHSESGFLDGYQSAPNVYDEMLDRAQSARPHWQPLMKRLNRINESELAHRDKQIRRMVRQNGIAYSASGDPSAREQHLKLDPLPQLICAAEWAEMESSLHQRAELLNLMLADLYGPRTLLRQGVLPTEVLFSHPHYHFPYHELPFQEGRHLRFYSAEVIRSPQGNWWVKSDRTDSPGGSGFALENRIAISRAFPDAFRSANVRQLAPYFRSLRDNLVSVAKTNCDNPRIAILSAGAGSERYFEDSFLARYLGVPLVETSDLVVRSGKVMLKTLAGLLQVDVIFRRHPSHSLDPLELGGGSPGIPGILQVIRQGNVVVVNTPGSGLVESPIFMAFLPRICRALLGVDLKMPGVATWWGGEANSLKLMVDRIDDLQLLPAYRIRSSDGNRAVNLPVNMMRAKFLRPETMTRDERISLLRAQPTHWVAQEKVARSSSAVWEEGQLFPGYITLRTFLTASDDSWNALPGGLVRVSDSPYESSRNPFEGGGTKDAWVLSAPGAVTEKLAEPIRLSKSQSDPLTPLRSRGFLPSRIADNLYWLGRYLERADAAARRLRAVATRLTSESDPHEMIELPVLIRALALSGQIDAGYGIQTFAGNLPPLESALPDGALNPNDPESLRFQVDQVVLLSGSVRDRLSSDAWRIVQELKSSFQNASAASCDLLDLLQIIDTIVVSLAAFSGFVSECMTRTHGYHFLNIGRRLEHALQITSFIKNCLTEQEHAPGELLESILEVSESGLTYRSRYYTNLQLPIVLDLLLADELNPRSLAYQLAKLNVNLERLPRSGDASLSTDRMLAQDAIEVVESTDLSQACQLDDGGQRTGLLELLDTIERCLPAISTSISNRFFVHSGPVHQIVADAAEED